MMFDTFFKRYYHFLIIFKNHKRCLKATGKGGGSVDISRLKAQTKRGEISTPEGGCGKAWMDGAVKKGTLIARITKGKEQIGEEEILAYLLSYFGL